MKSLFVASLFAASTLSAGMLVFDDFSVNQGPLQTGTVPTTITTGPMAIGGGITRQITLNTLTALNPPNFAVQVDAGVLDVTNGSGDDSEVVLDYVIAGNLIPVGASNLEFFIVIQESDGNPTDVALSGVAAGAFAIAPNTQNATLAFPVAGGTFGPGGLQIRFNGATGWDLTADSVGIRWDDPAQVPEPGTVALLGAGLVAMGVFRRRSAA